MSDKNLLLPKYPCTSDMWDELRAETRPIVVYGMGNGADKLIKRFERYGITIADFFASDGFVRGHSFHGMRVKSFSEIRESYSDFVIVLSFASNRDEVVSMISEMDTNYDMYVPDMPVAGEDEYFDRFFYNTHYNDICEAYDCFYDEESKGLYAAIINYKLSGRLKYLLNAYSTKEDVYKLFPCNCIESIIDAGAYNGDTLKEAKKYFKNLKKAFAIEPDNKNFKKILKYCEAEKDFEVIPMHVAAWSDNSLGTFLNSGNRNSSISSTASFRHIESEVPLVRLDLITAEKIDYIKYDVEGAEFEALVGSAGIIEKYHPSMLISLYHRSRDLFSITNTFAKRYPEYRLYLRRLKCVPAWEIDLIGVL